MWGEKEDKKIKKKKNLVKGPNAAIKPQLSKT